VNPNESSERRSVQLIIDMNPDIHLQTNKSSSFLAAIQSCADLNHASIGIRLGVDASHLPLEDVRADAFD
jgi:hypothetical protein